MKLDLVHDIQNAYRKTLDSMSRPGLINNFRNLVDKLEMEIGCLDSTFILVQMLFDTEVKFNVCSKREAIMAKLINQLTYAKATEVESADYILVLKDALPEDVAKVFKRAYPGNLLDPHQAATIVLEADSVSNDWELTLTGPGIEKESHIKVKTTSDWVDLRADKNSEYPLGIDLIITDPQNNILCLPRTTQISKQVVR
ncbi:MAG: phosphonate C-P lyase system protein PhnH [Desulfosporosinus sp.]|nr:phosphonate C-P lyase system protein PhnH [Desulfosporosinus sp.]